MKKIMKKLPNNKRKNLNPEPIVLSSETGTSLKLAIGSGVNYKSDITWAEARPGESIIGDVTDPHVFNSVIKLISAVIKSGLKEYGEQYLDYENTLQLLAICNLESSAIKRNLHKILNNQKLGVKN